MNSFTILKNECLNTIVTGYYNTLYLGYVKEGNPDFLNSLKNTYANFNIGVLLNAKNEVYLRLIQDLPQVINQERLIEPICVCVPRSRANMEPVQMFFRDAVSEACKNSGDIEDGANVIERVKNTCTTHLRNSIAHTDGPEPYRGITIDTCTIDKKRIYERDVILIDDIYTPNCNIDEDCIQAILDSGARRVVFYAIAYTKRGG